MMPTFDRATQLALAYQRASDEAARLFALWSRASEANIRSDSLGEKWERAEQVAEELLVRMQEERARG